MIDQKRRTLLKGIGYGMALTATAASSAAIALTASTDKGPVPIVDATALPSCDITILQQQSGSKEIVSLMNLTNNTVTLDKITPVGLEHVNGSLLVRLNNVADGAITLKPGDRLAFEVEAISNSNANDALQIPNVLAGHVKISSDHAAFNGIIPVTVFDSQVA